MLNGKATHIHSSIRVFIHLVRPAPHRLGQGAALCAIVRSKSYCMGSGVCELIQPDDIPQVYKDIMCLRTLVADVAGRCAN